MIINPYRFAVAGTAALLLDDYPTAAAAYSYRLLRTLYTGALCRVRRSSDNTESDFYQGATVGSLNTTAGGGGTDIATWVGGGNDGFVVKWYDQSGNAVDAPQTTTTKQPKIVSAGTLTTSGSIAAPDFDGTDDHFNLGDVLDPNGSWSVFWVAKSDVTDSSTFWAKSFAGAAANRFSAIYDSGSFYSQAIDSTNADQNLSESGSTARQISSAIYVNSTSHTYHRNNAQIATDASVGSFTNNAYYFLIGAYNDGASGQDMFAGYSLDGTIQELIIYHANKTTDRSGITANQNTSYAVF